MTDHIRWTEDAALAVWSGYGHAGECGAQLFTIAAPLPGSDGGYLLMSRLPGMEDFGCSRPRLEDAQAEAERWLSEFVTSLGASFPDDAGREREDVLRKFAPPAPSRPAEHIAPLETGEPWRGPAQADWDDSRWDEAVAREAAALAAREGESP